MEIRIISLPSFKAALSGADKNFDFSPDGILGKFNEYFSADLNTGSLTMSSPAY